MKKNTQGFTLIELMIIMVILGVLASIAIPAFQDMSRTATKSAEMRDLFMDFMVARTEAVKRKIPVVVCSNDEGTAPQCGGDWNQGWIVFLDANDDGQFAAADVIRVHESLNINKVVSTIGTSYVFQPTGFGSGRGALVFCDHEGNVGARKLEISAVGRVKMEDDDLNICP